MAFEQKEGQGALFKNEKKTAPNQPDYKGDLTINGEKCWVSAWIKEGKNGKYMSLAVALKNADRDVKAPSRKEPVDDSEIPF